MAKYEIIAGPFKGEFAVDVGSPVQFETTTGSGTIFYLMIRLIDIQTPIDIKENVANLRNVKDMKLKCKCNWFTIGQTMAFPDNTAVTFCDVCNKCIRFSDKFVCYRALIIYKSYKVRYILSREFEKNPINAFSPEGLAKKLNMTIDDVPHLIELLTEV